LKANSVGERDIVEKPGGIKEAEYQEDEEKLKELIIVDFRNKLT